MHGPEKMHALWYVNMPYILELCCWYSPYSHCTWWSLYDVESALVGSLEGCLLSSVKLLSICLVPQMCHFRVLLLQLSKYWLVWEKKNSVHCKDLLPTYVHTANIKVLRWKYSRAPFHRNNIVSKISTMLTSYLAFGDQITMDPYCYF